MRIEVEHKYRVADLDACQRRLVELGAEVGDLVDQVDAYYAHPLRDFAQTDEALRIRRVGEANCVTYKGPKLDPLTKTRREIELPLASGEAGAAQFGELLEALGFRPAVIVKKQRRQVSLQRQHWNVEVALDTVDEVGTFVELELAVDEAQVAGAQTCLAALAQELGLSEGERRSYLELLLEARRQGRGTTNGNGGAS